MRHPERSLRLPIFARTTSLSATRPTLLATAPPTSLSMARAALLSVLCLGLLSACTSRSILQMDGRYEKARLPNHFDRAADSNVTVFTITATRTQRERTAWQDSSYGTSSGISHYSFINAGYGVELSLLQEKEDAFFGGYLGVSPEPGNVRVGGFVGGSQKSGIVVGTVSLGLGFNVSQVKARYEDIEWALFIPISSVEDSIESSFASIEVPLRAGLLLDLGRVSPYSSVGLNYMAVGIDKEKLPLLSGEMSVGLEFQLGLGMLLRAEGLASNTVIDEHWTRPRFGARVDFARSF